MPPITAPNPQSNPGRGHRTATTNARRSGDSASGRPYLEEWCRVPVRFHEVDSLWIVWHGHYVTYLEEGRRAFGRRYGIDYPTFLEHGLAVPLIGLQVDFIAPARLDDVVSVRTRLLRTEAAKLEFEYELRRESADGPLLATAHTVQVFTTPKGELLYQWPPLLQERLQSWDRMWITPPAS